MFEQMDGVAPLDNFMLCLNYLAAFHYTIIKLKVSLPYLLLGSPSRLLPLLLPPTCHLFLFPPSAQHLFIPLPSPHTDSLLFR